MKAFARTAISTNRNKRDIIRRVLLILLFFNAITAIGGGLALTLGWVGVSGVDIQPKIFASLVIPGVILAFIVGGSALTAAIAFLQDKDHAALFAILSGIIMEIWIITEMYLIVQFSWLQIVYLFSGLIIMILAAELMMKRMGEQTNNNN